MVAQDSKAKLHYSMLIFSFVEIAFEAPTIHQKIKVAPYA
jgi:hypothetical protein